jgi:hypothetical protein
VLQSNEVTQIVRSVGGILSSILEIFCVDEYYCR